ncbi:DUF6884 domain-containing protein [Microbacterium sp.]|uniref:DUF6884 domain-containing protein n=1 Tax=Microbacterium sp. TaxID=51671 RepID=UPI002C49B45F|nr:DUF6884 domain-containing protein [Microbacterium sp.]HWL78028.1 hypothetical protein [Microbacterium sp.]
MTRIGLVGCAAQKLQRPAPARDLYVSQLFRKASAYAQATCDVWFILSAKHHLVHPDEVLDPYNVRLGDKVTGPPIWDWATETARQIEEAAAAFDDPHLVVLAGEQYQTIRWRTTLPIDIPMKGLGIGEQLGFLTRELNAIHA